MKVSQLWLGLMYARPNPTRTKATKRTSCMLETIEMSDLIIIPSHMANDDVILVVEDRIKWKTYLWIKVV